MRRLSDRQYRFVLAAVVLVFFFLGRVKRDDGSFDLHQGEQLGNCGNFVTLVFD